VVLPFESLTSGERYDYFSEGLTEEMITELARLSPERLGVIARTSAMQFKSTTKNIAQIGSELGVSHVLEGSVRRVGERVRVTAQLILVSDESHLWAQSYERGLHDVLEVQAEVARAVAREIQIKLTPHEKRRLDGDKTRSIRARVPLEEPAERSDGCDATGSDPFRRQHGGFGGPCTSARCHGGQARHGENREGARRKW
jgi:TolB-like protein